MCCLIPHPQLKSLVSLHGLWLLFIPYKLELLRSCVFRSDLRTEALLSGSLYAPEYEFQNVIFRTLQSPVDYVRVCVFEKVGR